MQAGHTIGAVLIGAGAGGLILLNLWAVPTFLRSSPSIVVTVPKSMPLPVSPSSSVAPPESERDEALVALDASPEAALADAGATSTASDGTVFPPIHFEARSSTVSRDLISAVEPVAKYMRHHFRMKAVLIGHGDEGQAKFEYNKLGRFRATAVMRMMIDYGVSAGRIAVKAPASAGDRIDTQGVPPGSVEVRIEERFAKPKGASDG